MKRFFISAIVSMGCFMAHAQSVTIPEVSIVPGGEKSVDVTIAEGTKYTAFQFDVALPTGVSLKSASFKGKGATREITSGTVDGKYRVLSYDTKNEKLGESEVLSLTFEATDEFTTDAETAVDGIVIVDPEGNTATTTNGTVAVKVAQGVKITIPDGKKLAMVSDQDLDFSSLESKGVKAYICTGYEMAEKKLWLTRVNDVPANTPILVKGDAGNYTVPVGVSKTYYPKNYLFGDASADAAIDKTAGYVNYGVSQSSGSIGPLPETVATFGKGKAYFHVPSDVASNASTSKIQFEMGKGGKLAMVSDYDLDFTDVNGLKAYTVTGFDKNKTIWLTRVMAASAGTPLLLRGSSSAKYDVTSTAFKVAYVNMLEGNTSETAKALTPTMDGSTIYVLSLGTGVIGPLGVNADFAKGKAWLPVPTSFLNAASRGESEGIVEEESEVLVLQVTRGFEGDDETTGISRVASEVVNDVWYNLKGQRIDAPTKKGLYIKNGQKVVFK